MKINDNFNMEGGYTPENGEEKTLCILALDVSGSMGGVDAGGKRSMSRFRRASANSKWTSAPIRNCPRRWSSES